MEGIIKGKGLIQRIKEPLILEVQLALDHLVVI